MAGDCGKDNAASDKDGKKNPKETFASMARVIMSSGPRDDIADPLADTTTTLSYTADALLGMAGGLGWHDGLGGPSWDA